MRTANAIKDTTTWDQPRVLENLPGFLEKFAGNTTKLWSASKKNGSPHTIIIAAAGLRASEIARYTFLSKMIGLSLTVQGRTNIPDERCHCCQTLCKTHQAEGICGLLKVYKDWNRSWDTSTTTGSYG